MAESVMRLPGRRSFLREYWHWRARKSGVQCLEERAWLARERELVVFWQSWMLLRIRGCSPERIIGITY